MRFLQIAGKRSNNFLVPVQNDVDNEPQSCCVCCIQHVFVNGIFLQDARAGVGRIDKLAAVVGQNRFVRRNSWKHGFSPTGKTGEQVGLNKALCEQQVSLNCDSVDDALATGRQRADLSMAASSVDTCMTICS